MSILRVASNGKPKRTNYQVMANTGFGELVIKLSDGAVITVPQNNITKSGRINSSINRLLSKTLTIENAITLYEKYNVESVAA